MIVRMNEDARDYERRMIASGREVNEDDIANERLLALRRIRE